MPGSCGGLVMAWMDVINALLSIKIAWVYRVMMVFVRLNFSDGTLI